MERKRVRPDSPHLPSPAMSDPTSNVRQLPDPHREKVEAALLMMLKRTREGRIPSFLFIAEQVGSSQPLYGIVGRFRDDPARAIGYLAIMKEKVTAYAADLAPDLETK